jgi:alpha-tubulin suppressor-like RCC1 family protein
VPIDIDERIIDVGAKANSSWAITESHSIYLWGGHLTKNYTKLARIGFIRVNDEESLADVLKTSKIVQYDMGSQHEIIVTEQL